MLYACATLFLNIKGQGKVFSDVWMIAALQRQYTTYRILWLNTYYSRLIRRTKCYASMTLLHANMQMTMTTYILAHDVRACGFERTKLCPLVHAIMCMPKYRYMCNIWFYFITFVLPHMVKRLVHICNLEHRYCPHWTT